MGTTNFLRAFAECEIRDTAKGRWFFNSPKDPFMSGISVVLGTMDSGFGIPTITVNFDMPYTDGIAYLESGCFRIGNRVAVRIGYVGDPIATPWFWGMLGKGGDGLSLTPEGLSGSLTVQALASSSWDDLKAPDLKGRSGAGLYRIAATQMGCKLYISPNAFKKIALTHKDPDSTVKFEWPAIPTSRSAWEWILWLNGIFGLGATIAFSAEGARTLYVLTKVEKQQGAIRDAEGTPEFFKLRTYRLRGKVSPQTDEYPILSWGPDPGLAQWDGMLPDSGGNATTAVTLNTHSGDAVTAYQPSDQQEVAVATGVEQTPEYINTQYDLLLEHEEQVEKMDAKYNPNKLPIPSPPPPDGATAQAHAKEVAKEKQLQGNAAQTATIATVGVPMEFPGNRCNVGGCSTRYDDIYEIWTVTHNYAGGTWDMTLAVRRLGIGDPTALSPVVPLGGEIKE